MGADSPQRYLVVGFPGLVARAVLRELGRSKPGATVDVLVEGPSQAEQLTAWLKQNPSGQGAPRNAQPLVGQRASIDLGLSGEAYCELAEKVGWVLWCPDVERQDGVPLEESAVLRGAGELVELAQAARNLRGAVYLSSILALGDTTGRVLETELRRGQRFQQQVEESYAVAEALLERSAPPLPLSIARAAAIVGDGETGECPVNGALFRLVRACDAGPRVIPAVFRYEPVHAVSADFVARALVSLVHNPAARGRRVHLVEPDPPSDALFFQWVATACERTVEERHGQGLRRSRPSSPLMRITSPDARALQGWDVEWDTTELRTLCPELSLEPLERYMERLVGWCRGLHD